MQAAEDEAAARNAVLCMAHERMPSYALWAPSDVARETRDARRRWWTDFSSHAHPTIARIARRWVLEIDAA